VVVVVVVLGLVVVVVEVLVEVVGAVVLLLELPLKDEELEEFVLVLGLLVVEVEELVDVEGLLLVLLEKEPDLVEVLGVDELVAANAGSAIVKTSVKDIINVANFFVMFQSPYLLNSFIFFKKIRMS
jgi:hypothetical protein